MAKGLLGKVRAALGRLWDEAAPAVSQGSSELASAMYTGSGFVHPEVLGRIARAYADNTAQKIWARISQTRKPGGP